MRRARVAASLAATAAVLVAAPSASAAPANITTVGDTFTPASYTHDGGTVATLSVPPGSNPHNVTSTTPGLFNTSSNISSGSTPVNGTQFLPAGTYAFSCTVHPATMSNGSLTVTGAPLARPSATVVILSRTVEQVVKSGKLKVKVTASAGATGRLVAALGGKKVLGTASLTASVIKLSKAGRKALAGKKTAKVRVAAEVDFGTPASATKKLK